MAKPHIETCDELNPAKGKTVRDRYDAGPGMYVIILNSHFEYSEDPLSGLNYSSEKNKWESLLKGSDHKVYYGIDLEPYPVDEERQLESGKDENSDLYFDDFIDFIKEKIKAEQPKFVFFYIASHGDDDGNFYLASRGQASKPCKMGGCMEKATMCSSLCSKDGKSNSPRDQHANKSLGEPVERDGARKCHHRKMDVLIQDIQNLGITEDSSKPTDGCFNLVGRPKIFVEQICRGNSEKEGVTPTDFPLLLDSSVIKPPVTLALQSDTIRLHATVSNKACYVQGGSSWLFDQLYSEAMKFKTPVPTDSKSFTADQVEEAKNKAIEVSMWRRKNMDHTGEVHYEDLLGGWFPDLCQRVCCRVGLKDVWLPKKENVGKKEKRDKQQPEFTSTLHRKLSCFDLFR